MRRWPLLALLFSNLASAEPRPTNLALTLSGGVSLGVYQAGFLYFATETVKSSGGRMRVPILTGASAGSANALITAINLCSPPNPDPTADLGWQTWLPVGHKELFLPEEVSAIHIFSKKQILLALERIRLRYKEGLPEDCDLVLGVSVTRLAARQVELGPGLFVPRLDERMVVRIRGRGLGQPVWVTNYLDPSSPVSHPLLPFATEKEPNPDQDFDLLRDLIFASGAFPLAFAPQPLKHCLSAQTSSTAVMRCQNPPIVLPFFDGGVFDNNPLRLSTSLVQQGLQEQGDRLVWRPVPNGDGPGPEVLHVYLDPDSTAYPALEEDDDPGTSDDALSLTWLLGREFIATARAKELAALVDASGELKSRMRLTQSNYPMASAQLERRPV